MLEKTLYLMNSLVANRTLINNWTNIPLIGAAINGWLYATSGFANETKSYRRKQQLKSFF